MVWLPIGNQDYGFRDARPSGRVFAVTGDYASVARNHCAATMLTNAVMLLCPESPDCRDLQRLFSRIHAVVGNGPALRLQGRVNRYLQQTGLPYECVQTDRHLTERTPDRLVRITQEQLAAGMPVALLVAASPFRWHWVLALSMEGQETAQGTGGDAFRISDSWHARQTYRYTPDQGSRLMAVCQFQQKSPFI